MGNLKDWLDRSREQSEETSKGVVCSFPSPAVITTAPGSIYAIRTALKEGTFNKNKLPSKEEEYLGGCYEFVCKKAEKVGLQRPAEGIVEKSQMHVAAIEESGAYLNETRYGFIGTYASNPVPEGKDYRDVLGDPKGTFKFPIHSNIGASGALLVPYLVDKQRYVFLKEPRFIPLGMYVYAVPRGFTNQKVVGSIYNYLCEKPAETAVRETQEETGISLQVGDCVDLGVVYPESGYSYNKTPYYFAPIKGNVQVKPEKRAYVKLLSFEEVCQGIYAGIKGDPEGINCMYTLAAMMKVLVYQGYKDMSVVLPSAKSA